MMRENTSGLGQTMSLIGRLGKSCARTGFGDGYAASTTVIVVIARIKLGRRACPENAVMVFSPAARDFLAARYAVEGLPMSGKVQRASRTKAIWRKHPNRSGGWSPATMRTAARACCSTAPRHSATRGRTPAAPGLPSFGLSHPPRPPFPETPDTATLPFQFEPPSAGGHLRIVQSPGKPRGYDPARDPAAVPPHP